MRNEELRELIEEFSFGVLSSAINLSLGLLATAGAITTSSTNPAEVWKALEETSTLPAISKESFRNAFWRARNQGLLKRKQARGKTFWTLTKQGRKRLASTFPIYQEDRPWDRKLYLVTYDIPEEQRADRTLLQKMLKKLGAGQLQKSIYLLLWDPTEVIKGFIKDHGLSGMVIISNTGTDGSIGEKSLDELVWEIFQLDELNERYKDFIQNHKRKQLQAIQLAFLYFSILKDDPQLPFELLGPTWKGTKAYTIFKSLTKTQESLLTELRSQPN